MSKKRKFQEGKQLLPKKNDDYGPPMPKKKVCNDKRVKKEAVTITGINVASFAEHRSIEIQAMTELVNDTGGNHTAFQKLPRHMRRRAMSHNIKRIPKRLHTVAKLELSKTKAPGKRPSRRHRRRPSNLLSEYERRKRRVGWLETHIWHAKRFKMIEKWGYRLALHPNDKSVRACYRAVKRHCLLQDVSFESYIELKGHREDILDGLRHFTNSDTGPTFAAKMNSDGTRQGCLVLYNFDSYPRLAIGPVTYIWRSQPQGPVTDSSQSLDTVWLSCHPSIHNSVLTALEKCFNYQGVDYESIHGSTNNTGITVKSLKDHLVKFRLFGPASNLVLAETLKLANIETTLSSSPAPGEADESLHLKAVWWKEYYSSNANKGHFLKQCDLWSKISKCQSPSEAPPNTVLALTVKDPRLMLPPKRNKVNLSSGDPVTKSLPMDLFKSEIAVSPLWESSIREEIKALKIFEQELNFMKNKHLVPGTPLELGDRESRIPIILIQRPGASPLVSSQSNPCHSSGWDLIIPAGFGMAFWIALVYRGARVGGIRESLSTNLQAGLLSAPGDYPDSPAGQAELRADSEARQAKHDRMPPAKRPNFVKLGIRSPFTFEFEELVQEWCDKYSCTLGFNSGRSKNGEKTTMSVLRNRKMLKLLQSALTNPRNFFKGPLKMKNDKTSNSQEQSAILGAFLSTETGKRLVSEELLSLVPVRLSILQRGVPATYGHICQPSQEDVQALSGDAFYSGPVEPKHIDPGVAARKEERKERLRLRKRQKRRKDKKAVLNASDAPKTVGDSDILLKEGKSSVKLCTKDKQNGGEKNNAESILGSTTRKIIGYVRNGDFDLSTGRGLGFGFCSVAALLTLIEKQKERKDCLVLVRNPTSLQYRFASISLLA
ncbi:ribonucleases p/mrp protein subunit pop1-like [Plakobranchus ocellatus]|uniref:Ribonucleases p/mrp protein subunit pop1-like n=1 Tax=Plakobranchus ocellatus TaxID=259542 RepID=A0AAV4AT49_9GAST|nr:ribonucleases p/mrp protein subunit pop1-like [Plakobranchus ocellatus]